MKIHDTFTVDAPAAEVFAALVDLERVAPCLPGVGDVERVGEGAYTGWIKIKVGPITMHYRAQIEIASADADTGRAQMQVGAKESRGQGTAEATADLTVTESGGQTRGEIAVDVNLSGRAASMGQGAIQDVSAKLVGTFAENLGSMLAPAPERRREVPRATAGEADANGAISVGEILGPIVQGRLRDPRIVAGLVGAGVLLGYVARRRRA